MTRISESINSALQTSIPVREDSPPPSSTKARKRNVSGGGDDSSNSTDSSTKNVEKSRRKQEEKRRNPRLAYLLNSESQLNPSLRRKRIHLRKS